MHACTRNIESSIAIECLSTGAKCSACLNVHILPIILFDAPETQREEQHIPMAATVHHVPISVCAMIYHPQQIEYFSFQTSFRL